jgi:hypothetical protein
MTTGWTLQIDRIVVTGVSGKMPGTGELQILIQNAVTDVVAHAAAPAGIAAHATVRANAPALSSGRDIAQAVASGVSQGLKGRSHG